MRLIQFWLPDRGLRVGVVGGDGAVLDVTDQARGITRCLDILGLLANGERMPTPTAATGLRFADLDVAPSPTRPHLMLPLHPPEVWGAGVTYKRSAEFRDDDTTTSPGIYDLVYRAPRPELFFKATASRCVGPNDAIAIRSDSAFTAAEPELALVLSLRGDILAYTICNDVSAWDIERENPLYLPLSKIYAGCCALGPVLVTPDEIPDPSALAISCLIRRGNEIAFQGKTTIGQMKRSFAELIKHLRVDNPIPTGTVLSTGTGIIQPADLALQSGDVVEIDVAGIGVLRNPVRQL